MIDKKPNKRKDRAAPAAKALPGKAATASGKTTKTAPVVKTAAKNTAKKTAKALLTGTLISEVLQFLRGPAAREFPDWPPDAFAIVGLLLQRSGGYTRAVQEWPPAEFADHEVWMEGIELLGDAWREAKMDSAKLIPQEIQDWWQQIISYASTPVEDIPRQPALCDALLQILAAADEACAGVGVPDETRKLDAFDTRACFYLKIRSTLCRDIAPSLYCVLPKLHTPQTGITLRSLTHHLALCTVGEVKVRWFMQPPSSEDAASLKDTSSLRDTGCLNLLLIPWPLEISALSFERSNTSSTLRTLPESMGFFSYTEKRRDWPTTAFKELLRSAIAKMGRIDGVVFPELALKSSSEFEEVVRNVRDLNKSIFIVAGVGGKSDGSEFDINCVKFCAPITSSDREAVIEHEQHKHHRWKLDEAQIRQYELTHRLDPYMSWWENTELKHRELFFFATHSWLTFSFLVCEDLARQDPIADLLRSVGPNLIIALLMDGPQIQGRWSGRYATVFADDPGSSVLALTSLGMARRSKPRGLPANSPSKERVIGIWKDADGTAVEIELPPNADGVVLSLNRRLKEEWSADGRRDHGATAYLTYGGVYPIQRATPPLTD